MPSVIETGFITEKYGVEPIGRRRYTMSFLKEKHLPQMMKLQRIIVDHLNRPDMLAAFSEAFMKRHLGSRGFAVGIFVDRRLVAFRNVYYPDHDDRQWNLGIDLGLDHGQRSKVANLQMVCVHPDFRGNGLAVMMNRVCLEWLRHQGTHPHICATVSPYNYWNVRVLLKCGFHIAAVKDKYSGKLRYIVYQNLDRPLAFIKGQRVHIPLEQIAMQRKILKNGYYGVALKERDDFHGMDENHRAAGFDMIFKQSVKERSQSEHDIIPNLWDPPQPISRPEAPQPYVLIAR
jgi:RimJ/RimL family protein N-acetyltransferase